MKNSKEEELEIEPEDINSSSIDLASNINTSQYGISSEGNEVGKRAHREYIGARIFYSGYTNQIKTLITTSPRIQRVIQLISNERYQNAVKKNQPNKNANLNTRLDVYKTQIENEIDKILAKMMAEMESKKTLKFVALVVDTALARMYHQGIHVRHDEFEKVRICAKYAEKNKMSLVFLPNHKSHIDYLVISYVFFKVGIALPHIAAGDNLSMPIVGWLLKNTGAFFIKRQWGNDIIYNSVMKEYIHVLLKRGHNIEAFIEGTRSRIGKLLQPKFGFLKIIMDAILQGTVKDCYIVPMSIGYDKVIETSTYVNELLGVPKEKESLMQIFNNLNILNFKLGRIDVRFGAPFSLKDYIDKQVTGKSDNWNPKDSADDLKILLQSLSYRILENINAVTVIMPTALVGTVLLTLRGNGVGEEEMVRKVDWLKKKIIKRKGRVIDFGGIPTKKIIERAVQVLRKDLIGYRKDLLETVYYPVNRFELSFYRNQVIHLFISESIVCIALYSSIKAGGSRSVQQTPIQNLETDVKFLSKLFKSEFVYGSGGIIRNMFTTLKDLVEEDVISIVEERIPKSDEIIAKVGLSPTERKLGRETYDFYCFLLWPFVETYWISAVACFSILPMEKNSKTGIKAGEKNSKGSNIYWVEEKEFLKRAQFFGKTLYYEGDVSYLEAINKETLKNGVFRLVEDGVLIKKGGELSVNAEWIPETGFAKGQEDGLRQGNYVDFVNVKPEGKLWDLCERIGKYRREGKNRRDTATVAHRVLRLAFMSNKSNL